MANDTYTQLNPGIGGDAIDEQQVVAPVAPFNRKRGRVVITGADYAAIVDTLTQNPAGSEVALPVRIIPDAPGQPVQQFGQVSLVPMHLETTVVSYVVPPNTSFRVRGFVASGEVAGKFVMYLQGVPLLAGRSSVTDLTVMPTFLDVDPVATGGQAVTVKVTHAFDMASYSFEGTILGRKF